MLCYVSNVKQHTFACTRLCLFFVLVVILGLFLFLLTIPIRTLTINPNNTNPSKLKKQADFKLIAKAYARIANSEQKRGNLEACIEAWDRALLEDSQYKYRESKRKALNLKKKIDAANYLDPVATHN